MNSIWSHASLAALLLCACRASGGAGPTELAVPRAERDDGRVVVCVVDARSGRPIEGATLAAVPEVHTPQPLTWWEAASCTSDADGVARLALPAFEDDPWLIVRAPGYAPRAELTRDLGPRIELEPAQALDVQVRDLFERPVEGAVVSWFAGCGHTPDLAWDTTDAEGRARLEGIALEPGAGDLWVAGASIATDTGYAPEAGSALVRVRPGVAARGRVVDADGAPLAGVFVGMPVRHHGPWTKTDAEGRARLEGIALDPSAGDLWVAGASIATDTGYAPEAGSALVRVRPGVAARGRVVDAEGAPLAGVFVGMPVRHHGPWTKTDADGAFELPGLEPPVEVQVLREPAQSSFLGAFDVPSDGRNFELTLPQQDASPTTRVALRLKPRGALENLSGLEVELVREPDGLTRRARSDDAGALALDLPRGTWSVRTGGDFSGWRAVEQRFEVAAAPVELALELEAQARWRFRMSDVHPDARLELVNGRSVRALDREGFETTSVPLPREGDCAARVVVHDRVRVVPIDLVARRQAGELELALPAPLQLRARLLDVEGRPVRGALWVGEGEPPSGPEALAQADEMPRARTWRADADLWVLPEDAGLAARRLSRVLPWEGTGLDLGAVVPHPVGARRVTLVDVSGAPLAGAAVVHHGALGRHALELGSDGAFESGAFPAAAGDTLAVRPADGGPTFHATLRGEGPWSVARPDTRVAFEVVDADGLPVVAFQVVAEGELFDGRDGRLELVGLDPGRHTAFVVADGRGAWRVPFEVGQGAPQSLGVLLRDTSDAEDVP